jgi:membrane associated rhomboid family serine protease
MFIPLKDDNPTSRKPIITIALIAVNSLVYIYSATLPQPQLQFFIAQFALIPYDIFHLTPSLPGSAFPEYLTLLTSMFLHGGLLHLGGNMLFLWVFGNNVEDYLGPIKFALFYLASGIAAAALFIIFGPNSQVPLVGASGAIAGVMGAYFVLYPRARILTLIFLFYFIRVVRIPAAIVLGFWIFYQIFMSAIDANAQGGVAWLAHVGGFAFGWILFKIFSSRRNKGDGQRIYRLDWS